jgi:RNA polymerase sigma-70 factor, ECF subfamily
MLGDLVQIDLFGHESSRGKAFTIMRACEGQIALKSLPCNRPAVESTLASYSNKLTRQLMSLSMLQRIASGDSAAVRDCMQEYGPLVWSIARRLSRTPSDAEDATQEIFLDIWRSAGRFDASQGSDKVFIAMIARRRLIDRLRKTSAEPPMDPVEALETVAWADPGTATETSIEAEHAARALAELRPEQRQVLELGLLHGLSQSEIATRLEMPLGTVKSFMRRGLIKVRELMNIDAEGVSASI